MQLVLVKQTDTIIEYGSADAAALRRFLFEAIDGATDKDKKAWRRFVRAMNEAGSGEYFTIKIERQRQGWRHRRFFALITKVFNSQERIDDLDDLLTWVKVGSGWVKWMDDGKGNQFPVPKSISYAECDEDQFIEYHDGAVAFLRTEHAQAYLFPNVSQIVASVGIETILEPFERWHDDRSPMPNTSEK